MKKPHILQFLKYNAVGILNTTIDITTFAILTAMGLAAEISQIISYTLGMANSYLLNRYWTFAKKETPTHKEALRFIIVNLTGLAISIATISLTKITLGSTETGNTMIAKWPVYTIAGKALAMALSIGITFPLNKNWVFKK
ncbi:GtrA family protein [Spirochaetia bacterium 38H-sp]|uniref:GtrA family protein n=1 Tax=Rarispira pelagica TaxID=3141764 RepID=A0ABU9UD97_9SPIR